MFKGVLYKRYQQQRYNMLVGYLASYFKINKGFVAKADLLQVDIVLQVLQFFGLSSTLLSLHSYSM
jgi:hypothetical protein